MSVNFCHISPVKYLEDFVVTYPTHLLLAHLIEENEEYRNFYRRLKEENPNVFYHVDNSAFEMFKRGQPMYDSDKLMEMASLVKGDSIVMSDYPKEPAAKTVESAVKLIPKFKNAGFKTFFCPQSELGKTDDLIEVFGWALGNDDIDFIGVSILACPIALGINEQVYTGSGQRDESYRMQRYLSRWRILSMLRDNGMLTERAKKRFHCLGMTDGPREISLLREFHPYIYSWDSSTAIWHGINGIAYDGTPTGLRNGKYEAEVDFDIERQFSVDEINLINDNMDLVDAMCRGVR